MRRGVAFIFAAAVAFASNTTSSAQAVGAQQLDPARLGLGREIVAVVLPPQQRQQIMAAVLNALMQNMIAGIVSGTPHLKAELAAKPQVKAVFDQFVARQQSLGEGDINKALPGLIEAYAHAYARNFTVEELERIKAFVTTDAGAKFVQRGPALLADPDVAAWQSALTAQAASRQKAELATFVRELKAARSGARR